MSRTRLLQELDLGSCKITSIRTYTISSITIYCAIASNVIKLRARAFDPQYGLGRGLVDHTQFCMDLKNIFIYLSIYQSIYMSACLYVCPYLSIYLSIHNNCNRFLMDLKNIFIYLSHSRELIFKEILQPNAHVVLSWSPSTHKLQWCWSIWPHV